MKIDPAFPIQNQATPCIDSWDNEPIIKLKLCAKPLQKIILSSGFHEKNNCWECFFTNSVSLRIARVCPNSRGSNLCNSLDSAGPINSHHRCRERVDIFDIQCLLFCWSKVFCFSLFSTRSSIAHNHFLITQFWASNNSFPFFPEAFWVTVNCFNFLRWCEEASGLDF